ncbi:MAG: hypothetical protein WCA00_07675, partial [Candidatus Acidiferrales bacterium]
MSFRSTRLVPTQFPISKKRFGAEDFGPLETRTFFRKLLAGGAALGGGCGLGRLLGGFGGGELLR